MAIDGQSRFASNGAVRLHYVVGGRGANILFVHGLPDFWNGWRYQLDFFAARYHVAAMDLRGCNDSGKPGGVDAYRLKELVGDVLTVARNLGDKVTLVGHDWGGIIAWWTTIHFPQYIHRLCVLAAPHPLGYLAALADGSQRPFARYIDELVGASPDAPLDIEKWSEWVTNPVARAELQTALARSNADSIRNYYRANLAQQSAIDARAIPPVTVPTLVMYGEADPYITTRAYANTHRYVAAPFRLIGLADCGHFLHHEAAGRVNEELAQWLAAGRS
jgi:pimeloyl-ACP methyl ester carboxylesterase